MLYQSEVSDTEYEVTTISGSLKFSLLVLVVWAVLIVAAAFVRGRFPVRSIEEKKLFCLLTALYAVAALYLICLLYTFRAHETPEHLVCRLLLEKKKKKKQKKKKQKKKKKNDKRNQQRTQ